MGGMKSKPARLKEDLARGGSGAAFGGLAGQLDLQFAQFVGVFRMSCAVLRIKGNKVRRRVVTEDIARRAASG